MDSAIIFICFGIFLLLCWSAFFSGSETALMASSRPRLHTLEKEGNKAARRVNRIITHPESLLSTILLGNNLVNIGSSALTTGVFIKLFGDAGMVWATLLMTVLVLIFAEVLPKTIASKWPEKIAMVVSLPMKALMRLFSPATWLIKWITLGFMRLARIRMDSGTNFGSDDLRGAIGMGLIYGVLRQSEHRMLDSILDLNDLTVEDVMVHRSAVDSIDVNADTDAIFEQFALSTYSRLPVWEKTSDNIIGTLHAKEFYKEYHHARKSGRELDIHAIMNPPYFIPETVTIYDQLREFRKCKRHMALVVDEYGDIQGLVTLEDLLEEIVGEIEDEFDDERPDFIEEGDGNIVILGHIPVRDVNRKYGWKLPEEESVSIAGLLTETLQRIPLVGEEVSVNGLTFKVLSKKHQSILRVRVVTTAKPKAEHPAQEA